VNRSRPLPSRPLLLLLRVVGAGLVAAMGGIHLSLWNSGDSDLAWIGPLFLADVVAGLLFSVAVLTAARRRLAVVAALGALLQAGTLWALVLSVWMGLFGFTESTSATLFWPSVFVEAAGAVVLAVLAALTFLATRTPERTPERIRSG
jgi:hypothetical protein